jgi:molybdopterin synthase catalytic subunit
MSSNNTIFRIEKDAIFVELTHDTLEINSVMDRVRSPKAGAMVLFAGEKRPVLYQEYLLKLATGSTRDSFDGRPVSHLSYSAYVPLALQSLLEIARTVYQEYSLQAIAMVHRLGPVPIGQDSILIAVSAPHRTPAWRAGEEALEKCKAKVEIWKLEEFSDQEGSVWRSNRDCAAGYPIADSKRA